MHVIGDLGGQESPKSSSGGVPLPNYTFNRNFSTTSTSATSPTTVITTTAANTNEATAHQEKTSYHNASEGLLSKTAKRETVEDLSKHTHKGRSHKSEESHAKRSMDSANDGRESDMLDDSGKQRSTHSSPRNSPYRKRQFKNANPTLPSIPTTTTTPPPPPVETSKSRLGWLSKLGGTPREGDEKKQREQREQQEQEQHEEKTSGAKSRGHSRERDNKVKEARSRGSSVERSQRSSSKERVKPNEPKLKEDKKKVDFGLVWTFIVSRDLPT